ncbi:hypothetical protein QTG54_002342 [Skeletonema marinoi]|uniref:Uncharacterized protein n=1 Tax=Skeletonema marinoi TaxID=267567 RepID=A0AAD9DIP6_9STRA|nr:hypothetical protein QTG54_002342 [Skeletonema marinoi]
MPKEMHSDLKKEERKALRTVLMTERRLVQLMESDLVQLTEIPTEMSLGCLSED